MCPDFIKNSAVIAMIFLVLGLLFWAVLLSPFAISSLFEDRLINFYGRVLDQHDGPVGRARITAQVSRFCPVPPYFMCVKDLKTWTDSEGFFQFRWVRGPGLSFYEIQKGGYEFKRSQNERLSFDYAVGTSACPVFIPDKNNPVIFRLRKKLKDRTFLFKDRDWGVRIPLDEMKRWKATDIVEKRRIRPFDESDEGANEVVCDLKYTAVLDAKEQEWSVYFSACRADSGVVVGEEELYEAPKEGYRNEWRIVVPVGIIRERDDDPPSPCVYIKSRSPSIYSKVVVETIYPDSDMIRMYGKMTTNPYGDRVLDSVDWPPYSRRPEIERILQLRDLLEAEARTMLGDGRLPQRPKIMALIEAVKRGDKTLEALERETREWKTVKNPNYLYQYWKRGVDKFERRIFKGAVEEFDEYLRRGGGSDSDSVYSYKGAALEELGDFEGALECYRSALEKFPEEIDTYIRFVRKVIRMREKMGDIEEAIADLKELSRRQHDVQARRLEEIERELALLEERPDQRRYRKLHSEKVKLKDNLEHWVREYSKKQKQLEEKLKAQQVAP